MKAAIITIGDELLIGNTIDTNSAFIGKCLQRISVEVFKKITIGDDANHIEENITSLIGIVDVIIVTGGLGPTKDDITKKTIASLLDRNLVIDETVLKNVEAFFAKRNRPLLDVNKDQALVIEGSTVLFNRMGTAPGMMVNKENTSIIILPGVPFEMMTIMDEEVIPRLSQISHNQIIIHKYIETIGIGESFIAQKIEDIEDALPGNIKLAYLPSLGGVTLRLTAIAQKGSDIESEVNTYQSLIVQRIEEYVYATVEKDIADYVIDLLKEKRLTLATAESCTGGGLSSAITDIPGASAVYMGSVISYDNRIKSTLLNVSDTVLSSEGAVSSRTVVTMAKEGRKLLDTNICISISGILGPTGGSDDKPVGMVFVGVSTYKGTDSYQLKLPYDRARNKQLLIMRCFDILRNTIKNL